MSELIHYKYICRIKYSKNREAKEFEFLSLEDLLFHISHTITNKDFDWIHVDKREDRRELV